MTTTYENTEATRISLFGQNDPTKVMEPEWFFGDWETSTLIVHDEDEGLFVFLTDLDVKQVSEHRWQVTYAGRILGDDRGYSTEEECRREIDNRISIDIRDAKKYRRPILLSKAPKAVPVSCNEEVRNNLTALGYEHTHHEEDFEDIGDAENGPKLSGGPAYDEYLSPEDRIIINHRGNFAQFELRDLAFEAWCDEQAKEV